MKRRMMIIFVDTSRAADVETLLESCDLPGYSEIPGILGKGTTGRKFGTRAFPGSSTIYLAAVSPECGDELAARLATLRPNRGGGEGLKLYTMDVDERI